MTIQYHEASDLLSIVLASHAYQSAGADETSDPDVTLHFDDSGLIAEIEIEHASTRLDLSAARRLDAFCELKDNLDVRSIRRGIGMSQVEFAGYLDVSVATLRNWEQGRRTPRGPARRLLELSRDRPGLLFDRPKPFRRD